MATLYSEKFTGGDIQHFVLIRKNFKNIISSFYDEERFEVKKMRTSIDK